MSHHGGHGYPCTKQIRSERRVVAGELQAEYDKLTTQQKIDRLPKEGAVKQRLRLELKLQEELTVKALPVKMKKNQSDLAEVTQLSPQEKELSYRKRGNRSK